MSTTNRKSSLERKGITYGAALSISIFSMLAPNMVLAQVLPEELEEPVRMQMLPICGKIEAQPVSVKPAAAASQAVHKVARLPVGTFNETQHVKEFSWLSDDANTESPVSDSDAHSSKAKATTAKPTKYSIETPTVDQHAPKARTERTLEHRAAATSDIEENEEPISDKAPVSKPAKVKVTTKDSDAENAPQSSTKKKEHSIDPDSVKVASKPHCSGVADYYADQFHGRKTASGQLHDKYKFTAAHRTLPFGTKLKVVNRNTGKACVVTVNDRGPFTKARIIDLSSAAAKELGLMTAKSRLVDCYIVENE